MPKLRHIAIAAEDPEAMAEFYKKAFDFVEVGRPNGVLADGVFLSDGTLNMAIRIAGLRKKSAIVSLSLCRFPCRPYYPCCRSSSRRYIRLSVAPKRYLYSSSPRKKSNSLRPRLMASSMAIAVRTTPGLTAEYAAGSRPEL